MRASDKCPASGKSGPQGLLEALENYPVSRYFSSKARKRKAYLPANKVLPRKATGDEDNRGVGGLFKPEVGLSRGVPCAGRGYRGRSVANSVVAYPIADPTNTSEEKCARDGIRESPTSVAKLYDTHGTHLWFPYRRATTVATENAATACPEGKLLSASADWFPAKNLLPKDVLGGTSTGRSRRVTAFIARSTIALSAYASAHSSAVLTS